MDIDADGELSAELQSLTRLSELGSAPHFVVDPTRMTAGAVAFGRTGRYTVCLDGGLLPLRTTDPAAFGAVIQHELAHISNLDVDLTYAVVALWRAFAALVLLPYVVVTGVTFAMAQFAGRFLASDAVFWPAGRPALIRQIAVSLFLTLLVYLTTADILRHRELHADADAVAQGADRGIWDRAAEGERATENLRMLMRWRALWRVHPSSQKRARSLHDPAALFSLGPLQLFLIGSVTSLSLKTLTELWGSALITWSIVGASATLVTVAVWRSVLYAVKAGAEVPSGLWAGCWLGFGLTAGELLTATDSVNRWLPPHPEVLLVLVIGAMGFTVWVTQCAWLQASTPNGVQTGFPPALCVAAVALAVTGMLWWQRSGSLLTMGNFFAAYGERNYIVQIAPGPWHAHSGTLSVMSAVLPELAASVRDGLTVLMTPVLWLYPLALWTGRGSQRPALRRTLTLGVTGGGLAWIGIAVVMASMHTWQPAPAQRAGAFGIIYLWWVVAVIWIAVAATGFAAGSGSRLWLTRALVASGVAVLIAIAGLFLSSSVDGCLGPLRVMGDSCHVLPATGWLVVKTTMGELLLSLYGAMASAVVAASIAFAVRRVIRRSHSPELFSTKVAGNREPGGIANRACFTAAVVSILIATFVASASADSGGVAASPTLPPPRKPPQ
ncbi:M48 family metalloprotease [Catenulispora pinisilvae]|uniref:M48 family metalloprotease n=1 Tax=Catenulispora pinisilvae TaxID=2705253 RepID=UPI0018926D85|nr:M48 family metalloprotease [Catenulispora pinisilvae]